MVSMNAATLTLVGNIASEPEVRTVASGIEVTNFRLAASDRRLDQSTGEWVDTSTVFLKVTCWRGMASNVKASLHKGDPVVVTGRLQSHTYVRDEQQRTSFEVDAYAIGPNLARGVAIFHRIPVAQRHAQPAPPPAPAPEVEEEMAGMAA